jgi:uncharacterized protein (DUF302 family)
MGQMKMGYYLTRVLPAGFDAAVARTREALAAEGFGVITEIDVRQTLKAKIGVEFRPYLILGACNPAMAYEALSREDKVGVMLPCNVVVQQRPDGTVEVSAIDPVAAMGVIDNAALHAAAENVKAKLASALDRLASGAMRA